jgi:hypothetical protein
MRRCEDEKVWQKVWRWEDEIQPPTIGRTLRSDALGEKSWLCADLSSVAICCHAVWFVNPPPGCVACLKQVGQVGTVPAVYILTYIYILYMVVNTNIYIEIIKVMNVLLLIPSSSSCSVIGKHNFAMCIVCVCAFVYAKFRFSCSSALSLRPSGVCQMRVVSSLCFWKSILNEHRIISARTSLSICFIHEH